MNLLVLLGGEMGYFYRSRVMLYLWVGMPLIIAVGHLCQPETEGASFTLFVAFMAASTVGLVAGPMITASLVDEIKSGVYVLFAVRPVARRDLLLARFLAVFLCVTIAALISIGIGLVADMVTGNGAFGTVQVHALINALVLSFTVLAFSSAFGLLLGVVSSSVYTGIILFLFLCINLNNLLMMVFDKGPEYLGLTAWWGGAVLMVAVGGALTVGCLVTAIMVFDRKQL